MKQIMRNALVALLGLAAGLMISLSENNGPVSMVGPAGSAECACPAERRNVQQAVLNSSGAKPEAGWPVMTPAAFKGTVNTDIEVHGFDGSLSPLSCGIPDGAEWVNVSSSESHRGGGGDIFAVRTREGSLLPHRLRCPPAGEKPELLRIVLYGSSHVRVLLFALLRVLKGLRPEDPLEPWVLTKEAGGAFQNMDTSCRGEKGCCSSNKHAGLDPACGPTGEQNHTLSLCGGSLEVLVFFKFKTFWHTPESDALFLEKLRNTRGFEDLAPDLLLLEPGGSLWGPRENQRSYTALHVPMTRDEQWRYYLDLVATNFKSKRTKRVWLTGHAEACRHDRTFLTGYPSRRDTLWQWDALSAESGGVGCTFERCRLAVTMPESVPYGHGGDGLLLAVYAQMILDHLLSIKWGPG